MSNMSGLKTDHFALRSLSIQKKNEVVSESCSYLVTQGLEVVLMFHFLFYRWIWLAGERRERLRMEDSTLVF